jgi:rhodanese-related sulfurtransferase
VCAYDSPEKFRNNHLQGALSLDQLKGRESSLAKASEIIFYCAWPADATAARRAAEYRDKGFINVKILNGGVAAWKQAGYGVVSEPGWWSARRADR